MSPSIAQKESAFSRRPLRDLLPAAVLVAVTLLAYLPALRDGFVWDDDFYVTNCEALKAPDGLRRIWLDTRSTPQYYPLVFTAFRLEYKLWGLQADGYHAVNILLHAASALLLWRLLFRLGVPGAWWAAVLFAVHPVHVESVAWVTELKNCLSGFFYLAALWAALRFYLPPEPCVPSKDGTQGRFQGRFQPWAFYVAAFLLFICALLSKTVTCSLPVAVLLILWWKRGRFSRFEVATLLPFFALGAALALSTATLEKSHVGAVGPEWSFSFPQRILIAGRALWFYAGKLVWPVPLTFIYPRWQVDAAAPWQYLFPLAALAALAVLWRLRGRIGRGPLAAALFFALTLAPALGFFNVYPMRYSFVADHFQYLASIGLIALAVAAVASLDGRRNRPAMIFCGAAAVAAFGALTWEQCHAYRDEEALWRDTLAKNRDAWMACNNLAATLNLRGEHTPQPEASRLFDEAVELLDRAICLKPDFADAYYNRGKANSDAGRLDAAIGDYGEALRLKNDYVGAYYNRGNAWFRKGRYDQAIADFKRVIELKPDYAMAYSNLGLVYAETGRSDEAIANFDKSISLDKDYVVAYNNRANVLASKGRYDLAVRDYDRVIRSRPNQAYPYYNRGNTYVALGKPDAALRDYSRAIELNPQFLEAYSNRAATYYRMKEYAKALADVKMCVKLGGKPAPALLKALTDAGEDNGE